MKKTLFLGFCLILLITACTKTAPKVNFEGKWVGTDYSVTVENVDSNTLMAAKSITQATAYTFNADGTFTEQVFSYISKGNWTFAADSNKLAMTYTEKNGPIDRINPTYIVVSANDSNLVLKNTLQGFGDEIVTLRKQQ